MSELTKEDFDKKLGELKSDIQTEVKDLRTGVGALFENIDDKLGLIIENQNGMHDDFKSLKSDNRELLKRVEKTEIRLDEIEAR